jgi:hypothetical protein
MAVGWQQRTCRCDPANCHAPQNDPHGRGGCGPAAPSPPHAVSHRRPSPHPPSDVAPLPPPSVPLTSPHTLQPRAVVSSRGQSSVCKLPPALCWLNSTTCSLRNLVAGVGFMPCALPRSFKPQCAQVCVGWCRWWLQGSCLATACIREGCSTHGAHNTGRLIRMLPGPVGWTPWLRYRREGTRGPQPPAHQMDCLYQFPPCPTSTLARDPLAVTAPPPTPHTHSHIHDGIHTQPSASSHALRLSVRALRISPQGAHEELGTAAQRRASDCGDRCVRSAAMELTAHTHTDTRCGGKLRGHSHSGSRTEHTQRVQRAPSPCVCAVSREATHALTAGTMRRKAQRGDDRRARAHVVVRLPVLHLVVTVAVHATDEPQRGGIVQHRVAHPHHVLRVHRRLLRPSAAVSCSGRPPGCTRCVLFSVVPAATRHTATARSVETTHGQPCGRRGDSAPETSSLGRVHRPTAWPSAAPSCCPPPSALTTAAAASRVVSALLRTPTAFRQGSSASGVWRRVCA